jgi:hypothetical protein
MSSKIIQLILIYQISLVINISFAKASDFDSSNLDYNKIYSFALDGDAGSVLNYFQSIDTVSLNGKNKIFIYQFNQRFRFDADLSGYLEERKSKIDELLKIFRNYWRLCLLNNAENFERLLNNKVTSYLAQNFEPSKLLKTDSPEDSINFYLEKYLNSLGLYTTGYGKTGKYYDLLVWKEQQDSIFNFVLGDENISVDVIFMDKFITLGWEEYSTFGKYYPGGWATNNSLFCVKSAYDINSENFLVSYLAHEGRHFSDYKLFPKLSGADLEYRAKLTELSLAKESLFDIINFFLNNANYENDNAHPVANYCVIRDLSGILFNSNFENDINLWKDKSVDDINKSSHDLLKQNTLDLKKIGENVQKFIKK